MKTSEKIKIFAKKHFGSLRNLAERLFISPENLSAYANDKRDPGAPFLRKMLKAGCDLNWLLDESDQIKEGTDNFKDIRIAELETENKKLREKLNSIEKFIQKIKPV
jgi:transcriptional regulator with XRE-family HTH domain